MAVEQDQVDWVIGLKKINLIGIDPIKLAQARVERGIKLVVDPNQPGQALITKIIVEEMPAPSKQNTEPNQLRQAFGRAKSR